MAFFCILVELRRTVFYLAFSATTQPNAIHILTTSPTSHSNPTSITPSLLLPSVALPFPCDHVPLSSSLLLSFALPILPLPRSLSPPLCPCFPSQSIPMMTTGSKLAILFLHSSRAASKCVQIGVKNHNPAKRHSRTNNFTNLPLHPHLHHSFTPPSGGKEE